MTPTFRLSIITPERTFFEGDVELLVIQAHDGEMAVLAGHEAMVVDLAEGGLRIQQQGAQREAACSSGFATILPDAVLLLLQTAEWPEEIDIKRAERDRAVAQEQMRQKKSMQEFHIARAMLARAMTRLRVTSRGHLQ